MHKWSLKVKNYFKVSAFFFETPTNSASISVPAFLLSHWSIFFSVHSWPAIETIFRITAQATFGTTACRVTGCYRKAGTSFLKRVTGRIFRINK
jgi:hypothetical protein